MPKVLIDIMPAKGHFHATLKIATKLKEAGYDVVYGSHNYLKNEIEKFGFKFFPLPLLSVVKVTFRVRFSRLNRIATFFYWFISQEKLVKTMGDIQDFQEAIEEIKPDMVLQDEQEVLKSLFYDLDKTKIVAFQTKPDTRKIKGIPPFTSFYLPRENMFNTLYCSLLWNIQLLRYKSSYSLNRILTFGQDNFSVLKQLGKKFKYNLKEKADIERSFGVGVKNIPRLVISPAAFDFPHPEKENVFRIGPLIDIKREGKINQPRYVNLLNRLELTENDKDFVVYCSLGTITAKFENKVKRFFKKISKVAGLNPDCLFILSTGKDFDISELFPAPANLYIFEYVPQVELLQYCDLMITHGGMNSITECVYNKLPMLVYPLSPRWDQPGNSARTVYHGLGLRGRINGDSVTSISQKLNKIKSNYKFYKNNVAAIKDKFEENNNSDQILEIVKSILNQ